MNNIYTLAITNNDNYDLIDMVAEALLLEGRQIEMVSLGDSQNLRILNERFNQTHDLLALDSNHNFGHLIVFSCDAILELGSYCAMASKVTIWSDPSICLLEDGQLLTKLFNEVLVNNCQKGIVPRTKNGKQEWDKYNKDISNCVSTYFRKYKRNVDPLIERTKRPRVLIDGGDLSTNTHLIDAFIFLEQFDVDIWCVFDGDLKKWMRPDLQIRNIPVNEQELYLNSVDCVILCAPTESKSNIIGAIHSGLCPLPFNGKDIIADIIDFDMIESKYFSDGIENELGKIILSEKLLREFNEFGVSCVRQEAYFTATTVDNNYCGTDQFNEFWSDNQFLLVQQQYFQNQYDDIRGSDIHRSLDFNRSVVLEVSPIEVTFIGLKGWAIDIKKSERCIFHAFSGGEILANVSHKALGRIDVTTHFSVLENEYAGFDSTFMVNGYLAEDNRDLSYMVSTADGRVCLGNNHNNDGDREFNGEMKAVVKDYLYDESIKSCIEELELRNKTIFKLDLSFEQIPGFEFRFKNISTKQFVGMNVASIGCSIVDDELSSTIVSLNDGSFGIEINGECENERVSVLISVDELTDINDVSLVVSSSAINGDAIVPSITKDHSVEIA